MNGSVGKKSTLSSKYHNQQKIIQRLHEAAEQQQLRIKQTNKQISWKNEGFVVSELVIGSRGQEIYL